AGAGAARDGPGARDRGRDCGAVPAAEEVVEWRRLGGRGSRRAASRAARRKTGSAGASPSRATYQLFTPLERNPPSTASRVPVTKLAASEARKTAAPASSSGR